jgi:Leucine-rich repeat (LRR) protein
MFRFCLFFSFLVVSVSSFFPASVEARPEFPTVAWKAAKYLKDSGNEIKYDSEGFVVEVTLDDVPSGFLMGQLSVFPKLESVKVESRYYFQDSNMGGIRKLQSLKKFAMENSRYCTASTLELLTEAPALTEVELIHCSEINSLHELAGIRNLETLRLVPDDDIELGPLAECRKLRHLNFKDAGSIDDKWIEPIAAMSSVESMDLSGTSISDEGVAKLANMPNLKILKLENCRQFTGVGFESFADNHPLEELNLRTAGITDEGLALASRFKNLKKFYTYNNRQVRGPGYQCLSSMKKLEILSCPQTAIRDEHLKLIDGIETLKVVWLYGNRGISGRGLDYLSQSLEIHRISLNRCPLIDSPDFEVICKFRNLRDLYISKTRIRPDGIEQLCQLEKLQNLNISDNIWIDDEAIAKLSNLKIENLFAKDLPRVTGKGVSTFPKFPNLKKLSLTANRKFEGSDFANLSKCKKLEFLAVESVKFIPLDCLAAIQRIPNLKTLELSNGKVTLLQLQQLCGMEKLEALKFEFTNRNSEQLKAILRTFPMLKRE